MAAEEGPAGLAAVAPASRSMCGWCGAAEEGLVWVQKIESRLLECFCESQVELGKFKPSILERYSLSSIL